MLPLDVARHRYIEEMQDRLKLTASWSQMQTQLEALMRETSGWKRAVRESCISRKCSKIKQEHIERVRSILTPNQVPAYLKLVAEREQRSREQEERDRKATH